MVAQALARTDTLLLEEPFSELQQPRLKSLITSCKNVITFRALYIARHAPRRMTQMAIRLVESCIAPWTIYLWLGYVTSSL
jgi:hypothetical protein